MGSEENLDPPSQWEEDGGDPTDICPWDGEEARQVQMCVCSSPTPSALPAQLLATLLIQYERLQGVQSSGVLIIFWFLCVVCAIIPFRSKILSAMVEVRRKRDTC